jgi:hypothetical protein
VQVYTSDLRGAGTDANVFLILYGAGGLDSGSLKLDTSKNNFERGQEDVFMVQVGVGEKDGVVTCITLTQCRELSQTYIIPCYTHTTTFPH